MKILVSVVRFRPEPPIKSRCLANLLDSAPPIKYSFGTVTNLGGIMATVTKTPSGTWKGIIRKVGWPTTSKTFRTKRDADDWARRTEDEMVRGVFIQRAKSANC